LSPLLEGRDQEVEQHGPSGLPLRSPRAFSGVRHGE
jgi:hypothetical protein